MMHANNRDTWVLTQNSAGDSIQAFLVRPSGIAAPVSKKLNIFLETSFDIKSSPNSEMFVATKNGSQTGVNTTEIFRFDRNSGTISPLYSLTMTGRVGISYSFSPNSSKLYVGTAGPNWGGRIYQFDLAAGNQQQIQQAYTLLYSNSSNYIYDLQLGIDGKIYVARGDTILFLPRINYPDQAGAACGFQNRAVRISNRLLTDNFPSLNQTIYRNTYKFQAQSARDTICLGESVQLSAYGAGLDHFRWKAANGLVAPSDTLANPVVSPTVTTRYYVTGSNPFRTDTASFKVVVVPKATIAISGPVEVSSQMLGSWYKAQNPQQLPVSWNVSGGTIIANLNDSIQVKWGETNSIAQVIATAIAPSGCPGSSDSLKVVIARAPQPVFYNIITPNKDGLNEAFTIGNLIHYPENELQVYNRWGKRVYQKANYENNWRAENVSIGIYYYHFRANGQSWKGWVEVVK